jgi:high-affinity iron transporter
VKVIFNFGLGLAALVASVAHAAEPARIQRLAALADYVAADYPGAVQKGAIVAQSEYDEQRGLIAQARALVAELPPVPGHDRALLEADLAQLAADVDARADAERVAADCRRLHQRLIDEYGLVLAPLSPPSEERAKTLYAAACASCHGADGRAQTEKARELKPPPLSFFDDERMVRISPSLAFHALTFGVSNTAMASFDSLPASDRWSLAFYVVSLRHRGERRAPARGNTVAATPSRLAELSDAELTALLSPVTPDAAAAVAWLRVEAPFAAVAGGAFAEARRLLAQVGVAADDKTRARELAIAAYLEGVEPNEAVLKARDPKLAARVEAAFFALRRAVDEGSADEVRQNVARAGKTLDEADELSAGGWSVPFFAALAIALREGFELSLLVAALLAFVRKSGHAEEARWVHVGWLLAVPAGVVSWFLVGAALGGARRELTEGVLTLVAAAMLLFVSHFVLGKLESRKWLKFLEKRTVAAAKSTIHWPLASMAFVAAFREALEIVLFFRALILGEPGHAGAVAAGAAAGVVALSLLVLGMAQLGRRLDPRPVMLGSSILLTALALSLVGQGIHALQEGGYLSLTPLHAPSLPTLGLYANAQGVITQLVVLAVVLLPWYLERRKSIMAT